MIKRVFVILQNSFREMYRDRFFVILIFAVVVFFLLSILLGELSFEEHKRILFDLGISSIHWLNLGLSIFIGGTSLKKEIDKQTYMTLLVTPLSRFELILGKFFGIISVCSFSTIILGLGLFILLGDFSNLRNLIVVLVGIISESAVLLSASILLSLLLSSFVSIFTTLGIFFVGNWLESLVHFATRSKNQTYIDFANVISWIFPNLYRFNWRSVFVLETGIPINVGVVSLIHAFAWCTFFLILSNISFKKKKLI